MKKKTIKLSLEKLEYGECKRKKRFRDMKEATRISSLIRNTSGQKLRIYECDFCKGFHLTSWL